MTAIAAGRDFTVEIDAALAPSDAVLAVIGPGWLSAESPDGRPRLFQPDDFVRRELVAALATDIPVVPVLVGGAAMPSADHLPVELAGLAQRQAVVVRDESFHGDVELLLQSLRGEQPGTRTSRSRLLAVGLAPPPAASTSSSIHPAHTRERRYPSPPRRRRPRHPLLVTLWAVTTSRTQVVAGRCRPGI